MTLKIGRTPAADESLPGEKIVVVPTVTGVKRGWAWLTSRLADDSLLVLKAAKKLSPAARAHVHEAVLERRVGQSLRDLPRTTRDVVNSFMVGQVPWYFIGPSIPHYFPGIRETPYRWWVWGLDKLFLAADKHTYETPGLPWENATLIAQALPKNKLVGGVLLAGELATDMSRAVIEYWAQRKTGIFADAAARAYGQSGRPFWLRYSNLEWYQKAISYAVRPDTIGSYEQIRSSVGGIMGSLFRTGPQLGAILALHAFLKKHQLYKYTPGGWAESGMVRLFPGMQKKGRERIRNAEKNLSELFERRAWRTLRLQLNAQRRSLNPFYVFRPALTEEQAGHLADGQEQMVYAYMAYRHARKLTEQSEPEPADASVETLPESAGVQSSIEQQRLLFLNHVAQSQKHLETAAGKKAEKLPELKALKKAAGEFNGELPQMRNVLHHLLNAHRRLRAA